MRNSFKLWTFEVIHGYPERCESVVELFGALPCRPFWTKCREAPGDLSAVHAITSFVRPGIFGVSNFATRNSLLHDVSQFADAVILVGAPHVEGLIVDYINGR